MSMAAANRYARALADVLGPQGDFGAVSKELDDFASVWRESSELRQVLTSPTVATEQKRKVLDAVIERLGLSVTVANFLRVLLMNYRMAMLEEVLQAFRKVANERLGIVEVQVLSAEDLTPDEQEALRARFAELTGKRVEMKFRRDANLIGGLQARVGSVVYDGSVQGYLERLRGQLTAP
ncbi:MAG TPA: ATP synthase F1 subunit delta [Terriglobia bacterium]|jgi:F-type H+-transporting ATPase subunit delta|nr:ATP synthase F1 subunit delta [Terriglobia bacterium]